MLNKVMILHYKAIMIISLLFIAAKVMSDGLGLVDFAFSLQRILYFKWESGFFYIKFEIILLKVPAWILN